MKTRKYYVQMLKATQVTFEKKKEKILDNVSIELESGQTFILIGPSGSGKSILMSVLSGIIKPTQGDVRYNGESIYETDIYKHRQKVRYVPAKPDFFTGTVEEHLCKICEYLNVDKGKGRAIFLKYFDNFSLDENILVKKTSDISTGEGKRIFLIQNLLIPAEIYILDEVFSGLDPEIIENGFSLIKKIAKAVVITSHNISFMKKINSKSAFLKNGKIIEIADNFFTNSQNEDVMRYLTGGA